MACCYEKATHANHKTSPKKKEMLLCLKCGIPKENEAEQKDLLKRFLKTHFLDLEFQIQTRMIRKITMEQLDEILVLYSKQIKKKVSLDFFLILKKASNTLEDFIT